MKLIILAAYPVQYHAPVFREISRKLAQKHHECLVIYLSNFSIQGYLDQEFGTHITWDEPLLAGYRSLTLNSSRISQPLHFFDLKSPGWKQIIQQEQPNRLLVTNLNYQGIVSATIQARLMGIPCTLRVETNDLAFSRTKLKDVARKLIYQNFYRLFDSAIAISSLNREHLIGHGISSRNIEMSYYCVPNRFQYLQSKNKQNLRQKLRQQLGFNDEQTVILFSGKLISKKNPQLLLEAASIMPENKHRYLG
jgi:glycosyltransferase involved in cell wall biosynthesis